MTTPTPTPGTKNKVSDEAKSLTAEKQAAVVNSVMESKPGDSPLESDATIIGVDDDLSAVEYDEKDGNTLVEIKSAIVEEFFFPDTRRPSYRTLFHAGQMVPKAYVDEYNANMKRRAMLKENGGVDPENPAGIDSTTIASGTRVKLDD